MGMSTSTIIIIVAIIFAIWLIYSQNSNKNASLTQQLASLKSGLTGSACPPCPPCPRCNGLSDENILSEVARARPIVSRPQVIETIGNNQQDPYADPIKKQDLYSMYDPLTYPQMRLPREVLEKYNAYYSKTGAYPPFNQMTQPMFDNPILNGVLIKQTDENEPFSDNTPSSVPLFRVKSAKNTNRFFYYIVDQRYFSRVEMKIPLYNIKINNIRHTNSDFYGLPEIYDGDIIENIPIYPDTRFKVMLYKTYHFP